MFHLSRRQFCQFAGSTLVTLGLNRLNIQQQGERYGRVLAQGTPRKLALLVGINKYSPQFLDGCVNDVELQRHLLVHRFGFHPSDILALTDERATRQGILDAFEEHLIKQAQPGDVVVFHYSGHGSRVLDPDAHVAASDKGRLEGTFVPINSSLPPDYPERGGVVQDIMGHTLFLLMSALQTENVTAVLDSCFSGGASRNTFRVRAREGSEKLQISSEEKSYQDKWLSRLNLSRPEFVKRYQAGVAKGVVLAATAPDQKAADAHLNGFYAGAFTYLLTQYLWQQTGTVGSAIAHVVQEISQEYEQTPRAEVKAGSHYESQLLYFSQPARPVAQAVITQVKANRATLWLGGVDMGNLDDGTVFAVLDAKEDHGGKVTLRSRNGLVGEASVEGMVQPGSLLKVEGMPVGM